MDKLVHHILCLFGVFILASNILYAQTIEEARRSFKSGNYEDAIIYFDGIIAMYEDGDPRIQSIQKERDRAKQCLQLIEQASSFMKRYYYTNAIEKYQEVLTLNPNDPVVPQRIKECKENLVAKEEEEWGKCASVSDFQAFIKAHPNSNHVAEANRRIQQLIVEEDEQMWHSACLQNTIEAYESYLSKTRLSEHKEEANVRLLPLYSKRADELFAIGNYKRAELDYIKVIAKGEMTPEKWTRYHKSREENLYERISRPQTREYTDMLSFVKDYPNSQYISLVRGYLVEYDMKHGFFNDAREQVSNYEVASSSTTTPDKKTWLRIIKEREKTYIRNRDKTGSKSQSKSRSIASGSDSPFMIGLPVKISSALGPSISSGVSIGGWCAPFDIDVLIGYNKKTEKAQFSVDPMYSIKRYESSTPFNDFHICVGPSFMYSKPLGASFGLRSGIGLHYSRDCRLMFSI